MRDLVALVRQLTLGLPEEATISGGDQVAWWHLAIVPTLGGLAVGLLVLLGRRLRARDIVDPIEANAIHGGRMSLYDSARLVFATVLSNGVGASVGMEAAYTQWGAGLLSAASQALRLRREDCRVFVAAGAGAAIAAAFNAPLAGAFYGYELVLGSYTPAALAQVALACLTGTLVERALPGSGDLLALQQPAGEVPRLDYPLFAIVGLLCGVLGILAMRLVTGIEAGLRRAAIPAWLRPALGGIALGLIAFEFPQALGSGRGAMQWSFADTAIPLPFLAGLVAAKLVASSISIGSGFRGGLFSASLALGCLFGAALAQAGGLVWPSMLDQRSLFMLVGMGAMAAAVVGAPVTMVLLVLEATGDFELAMGVLAGVVCSATLVRVRFGYSFATWRFHQRGVAIRGAHDVGWISDLSVGRMMNAEPTVVPASASLTRLRELVPYGRVARVFGVDDAEHFVGSIDVAAIYDPDLDDAAAGLVAYDLAGDRDAFLLPGQNIRVALRRFSELEEEMLPVLASAESPKVVGYLTEAFALRRYADELESHRSAELGLRGAFNVHASGGRN